MTAMPIANIAMIVFDIDGVLTDGSIYVDDHGVESKRFHVRDGSGIAAAMRVGMQVGVITGRASRSVTHRLMELRIPHVLQRCHDKAQGLATLCAQAGVTPDQCAYLGDDLIDLPAMRRVGYPMAVADAADEVKQLARFVTPAPGGHGAARQAIEHLLKAQDKWEQVLARYSH